MRIYLPTIKGPHTSPRDRADSLAQAMIEDSRQERELLAVDEKLTELAMERADALARGDPFFGHVVITSSGSQITVNEWLRDSGYSLPDWYIKVGNNCESLVRFHGPPTNVRLVLNAWANSESHSKHIFGMTDFFAGQTRLGCGYASPLHEDVHFWVVLTSH